MKIIYLNRANKVLGIYAASSGGISGTLVDSRLIFAAAIRLGASALMLCHNHPSGNLKPSQNDKALTHKIKSAAAILDITLHDHIILSPEGFYSFADEGIL